MADKKFSDLVANADTNLAVAAVGDYLLIYDISEPLDVNKIKVISIADFQDSIKAPVITARQGGSATINSTPGTTNYVPVSNDIQIGSANVAFVAGTYGGQSSITFPHEFTYAPIVLAFILAGTQNGSYSTVLTTNQVTKSGFNAIINNYTAQSGAWNQTVFWIAILAL